MSSLRIIPAEQWTMKGKFFVWGTPKSGKSHFALELATKLASGEKVGVISSERGVTMFLQYKFPHDMIVLNVDEDGDPIENPFTVERYLQALDMLVEAGCGAIVIDSASHAWEGPGGMQDQAKTINREKNKQEKDFQVWDIMTPIYRKFLQAIFDAPVHIIATGRSKDNYTYEVDPENKESKKKIPINHGLAPVMRPGFAYEFYAIFQMLPETFEAHLEGTYCDPLLVQFPDRTITKEQTQEAFGLLAKWLEGKAKPEPLPMEAVLMLYKEAFTEKCQSVQNWKERLLRQVLELPRGVTTPSMRNFTPDQVAKVKGWVVTKITEAQPTGGEDVAA